MEDTKLIELAQKQDEYAFNTLIAASQEKVRASVQQKYKFNFTDLDDVMQKATIKAWKNLPHFRADSSFSTWYYRIACNEAYDFMKTKNIRASHEMPVERIDLELQESYSLLDNLMLDQLLEESAAAIMERKERAGEYQKMIDYALANMSESHRKILELSFDEDKSYKDMSDILKIPVGTVMSRLHSARQDARRLIHDYSENHNVTLPF